MGILFEKPDGIFQWFFSKRIYSAVMSLLLKNRNIAAAVHLRPYMKFVYDEILC